MGRARGDAQVAACICAGFSLPSLPYQALPPSDACKTVLPSLATVGNVCSERSEDLQLRADLRHTTGFQGRHLYPSLTTLKSSYKLGIYIL